MPGIEEEHRAVREDVGCILVISGFDVAGGHDPQLLVGFVEVPFCDP